MCPKDHTCSCHHHILGWRACGHTLGFECSPQPLKLGLLLTQVRTFLVTCMYNADMQLPAPSWLARYVHHVALLRLASS